MRCDGAKVCRWCGAAAESVLCSALVAALVLSHPPERSEATPFVCGGTSQRGTPPISRRPGRAGFRAAHCQTASTRTAAGCADKVPHSKTADD